jgi:hypothetical protein
VKAGKFIRGCRLLYDLRDVVWVCKKQRQPTGFTRIYKYNIKQLHFFSRGFARERKTGVLLRRGKRPTDDEPWGLVLRETMKRYERRMAVECLDLVRDVLKCSMSR